jgi:hypothetical protein
MKYLLVGLIGIAAFAGYKEWPFYVVIPVATALVAWNLMYFGIQPMRIASGGPLAYLFRISLINIVQAAIAFGVGVGLRYLIG